ncbi:hypothetical protein PR048_026534 [Dryococelus australis]|uniref:Huntingtin n=1 Tax=Dryococelus australis TaxID=614101 RepID=A0ABQ9GLN1_9NEOP|nr:hypothetical protein PR048_026534 [Dryococelus australis]
MNHSSNEVKQLLARVCSVLGKTVPPQQMAPEFLKPVIPMLVNGTKEKNSYVKANSELALVSVLRLRHSDDMQQVASLLTLFYITFVLSACIEVGNSSQVKLSRRTLA